MYRLRLPIGMLILSLLLAVALLPSPAGAGALDRTRAMKLWQSLSKASFQGDQTGCPFDYGPKGMRNIYCYLSAILNPGQLAKWSGMSPYVAGPHTNGELDLTSTSDFGHYNPDFIRWMAATLIPEETDTTFTNLAAPLYREYFHKTARAYYLTYRIAFQDSEILEAETQTYLNHVDAGDASCWGLNVFPSLVADSWYEAYFDGDYYYGNVFDCAFCFWIRRHLDGTAEHFNEALFKLIKTFDYPFLVALEQDPTAPGTSDEGMVDGTDPMFEEYLGGFFSAVVRHDWELALTYFSPENFRQQKAMGIEAPQYIEESLGLNRVDNALPAASGDTSPYAKLNSIKRIELTGYTFDEESELFTVTGVITLENGETRTLELLVERLAEGAYQISPPLG